MWSITEELGTAEATIPGVSQGGPAHIAFNVKYLMEYFQGRGRQVMLPQQPRPLHTSWNAPRADYADVC